MIPPINMVRFKSHTTTPVKKSTNASTRTREPSLGKNHPVKEDEGFAAATKIYSGDCLILDFGTSSIRGIIVEGSGTWRTVQWTTADGTSEEYICVATVNNSCIYTGHEAMTQAESFDLPFVQNLKLVLLRDSRISNLVVDIREQLAAFPSPVTIANIYRKLFADLLEGIKKFCAGQNCNVPQKVVFTTPIATSEKSKEAACKLALEVGFENPVTQNVDEATSQMCDYFHKRLLKSENGTGRDVIDNLISVPLTLFDFGGGTSVRFHPD